MIKKNIKKYALFCLIAVLACTMGVLINTPLNEVKGATVSFEIENVQDVNRVGTEITLSNEIAVEYNGSSVIFSNGSITYPNGKTYGVGKHKLSDIGSYYIRYYYKDGNVIITAEKVIEITDLYYNLSSSAGSITTVTAEESVGKTLKVNSDNVLINNQDGLILRLNEGTEFVYNKPIDLSKTNAEGFAEIITVSYRTDEMDIIPENWKYDDKGKVVDSSYYSIVKDIANDCFIKLTDAYDPNKYVVFKSQRSRKTGNTAGLSYQMAVQAGAAGQATSGSIKKASGGANFSSVISEINGERYNTYMGWNYGCYLNGAYLTSNNAQQKGISWGYDYKTNIVYAKAHGGWNVITELDNPDIYPGIEFEGFTTGEVYLSIYCSNYSSADAARVDVMSIDGQSGKELVDMYGKSGRVDFAAPEIFIDYEETYDNTIYAPFGAEVELPKAFVKEIFSDGSYSVNVYTNYNTDYKTLVTTKNNKLKLTKNTLYTVEYSATDSSGQVGKAIMNICPVVAEECIWVETEKLTTVDAGEYVTLPEFAIKTINNKDKIKYSVKVVGEKETFEFKSNDYTFRPNYVGKYKVIYEFSDNAYSGVYEYEFESVASNKVKFIYSPVLPRYVVYGETYCFEDLKGLVYSANGVQEVSADAYISVDGGDFTKLTSLDNYKITAKNNIRIKFAKDGSESQISEAKVITNTILNPITQNEEVYRVYKYFVGDFSVKDEFNDKGRPATTDMTYTTNQIGGNQTLSFVNIIDVDKLVFQFKPGTQTNYSCLNVVLTDVYDSKNKLEIKFSVKSGSYAASINGVEKIVSTSINEEYICSIEYNRATKQIVINEQKFDYGFEGFVSNLAHLDVVMEKVMSYSSITIEKVGNHVFRGTKRKDDIVPVIDVVTSDGSYEIGSTVTLNAPVFTDVISQIDKSKNSVVIQHDDGTVIEVKDITKSYDLNLDKYGTYTIIYSTADTSGNENEYRYSIFVTDKEAPEIIVNNYAEDTIVVVDYLSIFTVDYSVTDNTTAKEDIIVSLVLENLETGERKYQTSATEVVCNKVGEFAVRIVATDEYFNYSSKTIYIRVEGGK